jgi:hypothetical protein
MLINNILGVLGFIATLVGTILAVRSNQKVKTARDATRRVERKFKQYMAAQEFQKLATDGLGLIQEATSAAWPSFSLVANRIGAALLQARGAHTPLLLTLERDKLDVAAAEFQQFILSLPQPGQPPLTGQQTQEMISRCLTLVHTASELAGRLSVESMSESEETK